MSEIVDTLDIDTVRYGDVPTASDEEVLDFCNKVRAAGGANPLDALVPDCYPEDASQCLVARSLNFSCEVSPKKSNKTVSHWTLEIENSVILDRIASELNLKKASEYSVWLPAEIASVAYEFDVFAEDNPEKNPWFEYYTQKVKYRIQEEWDNPYQTGY